MALRISIEEARIERQSKMAHWFNEPMEVVFFTGSTDAIKDGDTIMVSRCCHNGTDQVQVKKIYRVHRGFGDWVGFDTVFATTNLGDTAIWVRPR